MLAGTPDATSLEGDEHPTAFFASSASLLRRTTPQGPRMTTRAQRYDAVVRTRDPLSPHLLRLTLSVPGFESSGVPDEWVGLSTLR